MGGGNTARRNNLVGGLLITALWFGFAIRFFLVPDTSLGTLWLVGGCVMLIRWVFWPLIRSRSAKRSAVPS